MASKTKIMFSAVGFIVLAIVIVLLTVYWFSDKPPYQSAQITSTPNIQSVSIGSDALLASGKGLERVEWWAIPTGTGITEADYQKLGDASLVASSADGTETWRFPIPSSPVLASKLFALGYDANGKAIADIPLPEQGATAVNDAVWAESGDVTIGPDASGTVAGLTVTLNALVQDNRCPADVRCIEAGAVNTNVTFDVDGASKTLNMPSDEVPQEFNGYSISITKVAPDRMSKTTIAPEDYRITFHIVSAYAQIRTLMSGFAEKLKNVSLLSPTTTYIQALKGNYSAYVSPALLSAWESDRSDAPGRLTSSPWPNGITINAITAQDSSTYEVAGNVTEITSNEVEYGGIADQYPATATVASVNGNWMITGWTDGFSR